MTDLDRPDSNEQWWYTSFIAVSSGFGALVFINNAIKFRDIRDERLTRENETFDSGKEKSLFWLNAIMGIIFLAIFIWSLMRMYMSVPKRYHYFPESYRNTE